MMMGEIPASDDEMAYLDFLNNPYLLPQQLFNQVIIKNLRKNWLHLKRKTPPKETPYKRVLIAG